MREQKLNILLLGGGGREHALAWKLAQSRKMNNLFTLPGNPGTAQFGKNISGDPTDAGSVLRAAAENEIDLVVIGPEAPLDAGVSDALREEGFLVFGPSRQAAQLECSKEFAKALMHRYRIPTAGFKVISDLTTAQDHISSLQDRYVIKVSGLASGKGVFLPESQEEAAYVLDLIFLEKAFGEAGASVVIEERLVGPEVSLLAFSDGEHLVTMPPAQDHKRLLDNDQGPNTGGMGVFAPSPFCSQQMVDQITEEVLFPTLQGMQAEGKPFRGVLYAGMILTENGPKVLEFNCRFGDPETQVILPLLEGDLIEICLACETGELAQLDPAITWKDQAAVCVVLASDGYPGSYSKGKEITGVDEIVSGWAFQAGTAELNGKLATNGGRVLGMTATGGTLKTAADRAYNLVEKIHFEGMQYRTDIARKLSAYSAAGVSIAEGNRSAELIKEAVKKTHSPKVLSKLGSFGGVFDLSGLVEIDEPALVASTDGVGTKVALAAQFNSYRSIGEDIVNHSINDILVQGAAPLFFLDYYACSHLVAEHLAEIVQGISEACRTVEMAILGGETAEMPGVYSPGHFDLAGTIVGVVERKKMLPRTGIRPGDVLIGLESSGPHTNGYSLIRKIFDGYPLEGQLPGTDHSVVAALLRPHRQYYSLLWPMLELEDSPIKALAHITGGGFLDNIPRVLPDGCGAEIQTHSWQIPPIFDLIQTTGDIDRAEMYQVFNMGIGMVAVVSKEDVDRVRESIHEKTWLLGKVTEGQGVRLV